jgi:hypothetical protein
MSCNTSLSGIIKGCDNNVGGISNFYVVPAEFVTGSTESGGTISAINMSGATKFVEFEFKKNTGNFTVEAAIDPINGSTFYNQTINLVIHRRDVDKRNALALIASGQRDLKIIVKDGNGQYWYFGDENSCMLTAQGEGSGTAIGDGSKYSLTFLAQEPYQEYLVNSSIIAGIVS